MLQTRSLFCQSCGFEDGGDLIEDSFWLVKTYYQMMYTRNLSVYEQIKRNSDITSRGLVLVHPRGMPNHQETNRSGRRTDWTNFDWVEWVGWFAFSRIFPPTKRRQHHQPPTKNWKIFLSKTHPSYETQHKELHCNSYTFASYQKSTRT